jgi:hypothetical protein
MPFLSSGKKTSTFPMISLHSKRALSGQELTTSCFNLPYTKQTCFDLSYKKQICTHHIF